MSPPSENQQGEPPAAHPEAPPEPRPPGSGQTAGAGLAIGALLLTLVVGFGYYVATLEPATPHDFGDHAALLATPRVVDPFALTDQVGERFDRNRLVGQWSLFFFGYTYCPDVCPTTLHTLGRVQSHWDGEAGGGAARSESAPQVVFVSVDPERDSPDRIGEYVANFDDSFVGATGEPRELEALARSVGVFFEKVEPEAGEAGSALGYLVDHSAKLYLVDPQARLRAVLDDPHDPEEFATLVNQIQRVGRES